ncbi:MAG: aminoacyl-tRNA hydrolase [Fidelibacterota bacterium]
MIAFIGLGNPELQYAATKHNAGYWVVDELANRWKVHYKPGKGNFLYSEAEQQDALLVKPTTGMNISGTAVKDVIRFWDLSLDKLLIIVDDVDLPLGRLRIRPGGGDGCHRGLESVIYHLGNTHFPRLRFGIAASGKRRPAEDYVLRPFRPHDQILAEEMVQTAADAAEFILKQGLENAMNTFNH